VSADGATVYSASLTENRMIAIDLATGDGTFTTFDGPVHTLVQFGVSPVDGSLVAGGQMTGRVFRLSGAAAGEGARVTASIVGEAQPWHPVFDAAGRFAYIPNKGVNGVSVFDAAADSVVAVIHGPGLAQPHGSALSADGRHLFVSNQNMDGSYVPEQPHVHREDHSGMHEMPGMEGKASLPGTVVVIDTQTREVVRVIEVGMTPSGMGSRGPR